MSPSPRLPDLCLHHPGPYCLLCKPDYAADAAGFCALCDSAAAQGAFAVNIALLVVLALGAFGLYKGYRKFKKLASKKVKTAVKVSYAANRPHR